MDFIMGLPMVNRFGDFMVAFDRFNKYGGVFILVPTKFNVEDAVKHFFKHVVKYWACLNQS